MASKKVDEKFARFVAGIGTYCVMLGLTGYDIQVLLMEDDGFHAAVEADPDNYVATFYYNPYVDETPEDTALHEVLHLFMARYRSLANYRFISERDVDSEEEKIVRTLNKVISNLVKK